MAAQKVAHIPAMAECEEREVCESKKEFFT